jgi:hypothetical protein
MSKRRLLPGITCALIGLTGGCVQTSLITYPASWPAKTLVAAHECPNFQGRYANFGELATGSYVSGARHSFRADWRGDPLLARNLGDTASGDWVTLRWIDSDTLRIESSDPTAAVAELHRSKGDFSCSAQGLERRISAGQISQGDNSASAPAGRSALNAFLNVTGVVANAGSGGVRTLTRRFGLAADGSIVMDVSQTENGLVVLIPYHMKYEALVRWPRFENVP